ncbi:MAG: subtilase family protein [Verrucomicrobia bacterium]|nr:subtilase family protein [Verrucomicrobiota bacterium]
MKNLILGVLVLCSLAVSSVQGTPADTLVAEGRTFLEQKNLSAAKAKFADAIAADANHANANFFYAVTRLLSQVTTPAGTTFLDRLGFSPGSRDIYHWNSSVPKDEEGETVIPEEVTVAEFSAHLRNELLPEIIAANANLAKITDDEFQVSLTALETTSSAVTVDYADVLVLRAILHGLEYWSYTLNSWNLDVQLTSLKSVCGCGTVDAEWLLTDHPNLFTFATLADQVAGRAAFENLVTRYSQASHGLRERSGQDGFLFMLDEEMEKQEADFKQTLTDLKASLTTPTPLSVRQHITFDLSKHFSAVGAPRQYFPAFYYNAFYMGTFPDTSFGGMVQGLSMDTVANALHHVIAAEPWFGPLSFNGYVEPEDIEDEGYTKLTMKIYAPTPLFGVISSEDASFPGGYNDVDLLPVSESVSGAMRDHLYHASFPGRPSQQYFQISGYWGIVVMGTVVDINGNPVANAEVSFAGQTEEGEGEEPTETDPEGRFLLTSSKESQYPNTLFRLQVNHELGSFTTPRMFGATHVEKVIRLPFSTSVPAAANDMFANAKALTGLTITETGSTLGSSTEPGEPYHAGGEEVIDGRSLWWVWTAPSNLVIDIDTEGSNYDTILGVYTGTAVDDLEIIGQDDDAGEGVTSRVIFTAVAGTTYYIAVDGFAGDSGSFTLNLKEAEPQ